MGTKIRRFVESFPWWTTYALGIIGIIPISVSMLADATNTFDVYKVLFLSIVAMAWIVMCLFWARLARSSIKSHSEMLDEYEHLFAYVHEMNIIVKDSLEALATYDPERAAELAYELNTQATKSLYDAYWRGDPREKEVEHE